MIPLADPARTGDALAAARELLPAWVVWGRTLAPPIAVLLTQLCVSAWAVVLLERSAGPVSGLHWTERARRIANTTKPLRIMSWCILAPALLVPGFLPNALEPVPGELSALVSLCALYLGAYLGGLPVLRRVVGWEMSAREWRRSMLTKLVVFRGSILSAFVCLLLVHRNPSPAELVVLVLCTAAIIYLELGNAWRLLRALGLASELAVPPEVAAAAGRIRFFEVELAMANALALPRGGVVLVTRRAREALETEELVSGLYHELGHMLESGKITALRASVLPLILAIAWLRPLLGWIGPLPTLGLLATCLVFVLLASRRSKDWERRADAHAHEQAADPGLFARATERLYAVNLAPAVTDVQGTHPHLYDRMLAAGVTPDYPRPEPASSGGGWTVIATLVLMAELVACEEWTQPKPIPRDEQGLMRALAIGGFPEVHLRELADLREKHGDVRSAGVLRAAAQDAGSQR